MEINQAENLRPLDAQGLAVEDEAGLLVGDIFNGALVIIDRAGIAGHQHVAADLLAADPRPLQGRRLGGRLKPHGIDLGGGQFHDLAGGESDFGPAFLRRVFRGRQLRTVDQVDPHGRLRRGVCRRAVRRDRGQLGRVQRGRPVGVSTTNCAASQRTRLPETREPSRSWTSNCGAAARAERSIKGRIACMVDLIK